ncbi:MAG: paraquat-inducible protein A [Planctomycetaceae bacterium]
MKLQACHCCGLIHELPELAAEQSAVCTRCQSVFGDGRQGQRAAARTAALAVAAFVLYWPAVLLPIVEIERLGHRHASSLLIGTLDLFRHGSWFVGVVVLVFSIVFPVTKLVLLLELSLLKLLHRRHKASTYRLMEHVGRWSMMDVLLLAFFVMLVKLGSLVEFHLGPAVVAFVACVVLSMSASLCFNPHAIWEEEL